MYMLNMHVYLYGFRSILYFGTFGVEHHRLPFCPLDRTVNASKEKDTKAILFPPNDLLRLLRLCHVHTCSLHPSSLAPSIPRSLPRAAQQGQRAHPPFSGGGTRCEYRLLLILALAR